MMADSRDVTNVKYCRKLYYTANQGPSSPYNTPKFGKIVEYKILDLDTKRYFRNEVWRAGLMGGWMGEGGDFQRTGWMVGSEKRDIHWVNDPRNLSDFVHNFQHHKKF